MNAINKPKPLSAKEACKLITQNKIDFMLKKIKQCAEMGLKELKAKSVITDFGRYTDIENGPTRAVDHPYEATLLEEDSNVVKALEKLGYEVYLSSQAKSFTQRTRIKEKYESRTWFGAVTHKTKASYKEHEEPAIFKELTIKWCCKK